MWLDDDQDKVTAFLRLRREVCTRCGTVEADWIGADGRDRPDPPYQAVLLLCPGCRELDRALEDVPAGGKGVRAALVPTEPADEEGGDLRWPAT